MTSDPAWALFCDWHAATGRQLESVDVDTLVVFTLDLGVPERLRRRRLRDIIATLRDHGLGHQISLPALPPAPTVWRQPDAENWDTVEDTLTRIPVIGWPGGLRGRRDAFLVVLCGLLGMSRAQARKVTPNQILHNLDDPLQPVRIAAQPVPRGKAPASCAACAVTRWLRMVAASALGGRAGASRQLTTARQVEIAATHDCTTPMPDDRWRTHQILLLPQIDRYGWVGDWQPLAPRSLTTILSQRQAHPTSPPERLDDQPHDSETDTEPGNSKYADLDWDELDTIIDDICARADATLARLADGMARHGMIPAQDLSHVQGHQPRVR